MSKLAGQISKSKKMEAQAAIATPKRAAKSDQSARQNLPETHRRIAPRRAKRVAASASPESIFEKYLAQTKDNYALLVACQKGVNSEIFIELTNLMNLKKDQLASQIFDFSYKTMERQVSDGKILSPRNSEIALKLVALYGKGNEIFGNLEEFNRWVRLPAFGLGFNVPIELMCMSIGIDQIMDELHRIEFGDLS